MGKGQGAAGDGVDGEDRGDDSPASKIRSASKRIYDGIKKMSTVGGPQPPTSDIGRLIFNKVDARLGEQALMGKVKRSPVTGVIHLRNRANFPDFQLVDLFRRMYLNGTIKQHVADEYLFRPVPLHYRTWLYHQFFRQNIVPADNTGYGMIALALSQSCIDAPISAGRWSPMLCHGPMILALSFVGDRMLIVFAVLHLAFLAFVTLCTNNPDMYGYTRLLTLPVRVAFLGLIFWRYQSLAAANTLAQLGLVIAVLLYIVDALGDLDQLRNYRHLCRYEVIRSLPNRILICKRVGAGHYEEDFGFRDPVPETVGGLGHWDQKLLLVADLYGILVELRPIKESDWHSMAEDRDKEVRSIWRFVGLDVYDEDVPSMAAMDEAEEEIERHKALNGGQVGEVQKNRKSASDMFAENL